ncbi:bifunctional DNA-formamidopyrimidine glycosylase/DNA-(apurinic or apyrimidinic site) lyase [Schleiferilactobacillus perolens]|jgi:formamidopyrimidine-DNA glycosylase|uniref:bifunctional DNA-formamidopyrimidine glycosylase/DNA-(apurinic or apyrimidinic site) lyase n=1 Tax=Schleiferilactobacillus perolens TaxID=100468 RepID=UPI002353B2C2|nr:bifunctional DNA-formamidopyrimidine glycosylase/DNA-(apurinic or apyrimidinic site) lyase [Schleiferilactobacillus perolens]MCI1891359.1 bifunctional DNA-formamidopyrimidine glycosylase/DNA-(apurinic or apyrimidinic site) lyase [Schleiferilactobacillus harbinensis]MCI1912305.1 bifunctional DNA-formamidopyrimidine glycosylase/DNA-(apurinic or apyrimidinic site) lyase [Schleiferilactobacillus harbinensis]MCI2170618.1 bifunctional DNA-formamidopyrimidine glycosylase/DNA-(apurinic or apyrimidini
MPELPEVETVRRGLAATVVGKKVAAVDSNWPKIVGGDLDGFQNTIIGHTIQAIDRRGKYLIFRFDRGLSMVSHLRMEGKYTYGPANAPLERFTHVVFTFTDGSQLRYRDMRKFGRMTLVATGAENQLSGLAALGPEPFAPEFTVAYLRQALAKRHAAIKGVLLNQAVVAGLGNIYADEVLWLARIHPLIPADEISAIKLRRLHDAIIAELRLAITAHGTTVRSFTGANGHTGDFQNELHVYDREGQPCERCGTIIAKIRVAGRGTHFCPHCQRLPHRSVSK